MPDTNLPPINWTGKNWVIVKRQNGKVEAWRDYGTAWGSPVYTVLGYATNSSHRDAIRKGRQRRADFHLAQHAEALLLDAHQERSMLECELERSRADAKN
jgi:hypothetical protein